MRLGVNIDLQASGVGWTRDGCVDKVEILIDIYRWEERGLIIIESIKR